MWIVFKPNRHRQKFTSAFDQAIDWTQGDCVLLRSACKDKKKRTVKSTFICAEWFKWALWGIHVNFKFWLWNSAYFQFVFTSTLFSVTDHSCFRQPVTHTTLKPTVCFHVLCHLLCVCVLNLQKLLYVKFEPGAKSVIHRRHVGAHLCPLVISCRRNIWICMHMYSLPVTQVF